MLYFSEALKSRMKYVFKLIRLLTMLQLLFLQIHH